MSRSNETSSPNQRPRSWPISVAPASPKGLVQSLRMVTRHDGDQAVGGSDAIKGIEEPGESGFLHLLLTFGGGAEDVDVLDQQQRPGLDLQERLDELRVPFHVRQGEVVDIQPEVISDSLGQAGLACSGPSYRCERCQGVQR